MNLIENKLLMNNQKNNTKHIYVIFSFGLLTAIILNIPGGFYFLYPFMILGTWFHEFSHGITALLLGGDFHKLVVFPDGSGYAQFAYDSLFLGRIGESIVAAAGSIGPILIGALLIILSTKEKYKKTTTIVMSIIILISTIIWVRPLISFGVLFSLIIGISLLIIGLKGNNKFNQITLQFLAVQAYVSLYLSVGYLFSRGAYVDGTHNMSDTEIIAENLFLPHWFWAILIIIFSLYIIYLSLKYLIKKSRISSN